MTPQWLHSIVSKSAYDLEKSGKALFRFGPKIEEALAKNPIQAWEAALWGRGLNHRLIRLEGYFFRVGTGKAGCLSFFVRNPAGLQVGLRREAITQAATYVSLITDFGYARQSTRFETGWMDVAVYGDNGKAFVYAENKANAKVLDKLCGRLATTFQSGVPFPEEGQPIEDAIMKAQHIWLHRPRYFWGVSPTSRKAYEVAFTNHGFELQERSEIPNCLEWESLAR
jgi:hypothetical protein